MHTIKSGRPTTAASWHRSRPHPDLHADEDGRLHSSAKSGKPPELKRERPAGRRAAKRQNSLIYRPLSEPLEGPCRWSLPRSAVEVPLGFVCVLDRSPRRPGQAARLTLLERTAGSPALAAALHHDRYSRASKATA